MSRDYATSVRDIADELAGAIVDTLLGYYAYWPHCPVDDQPLTAGSDDAGKCWWFCTSRNHVVAQVGQLPPRLRQLSARERGSQRGSVV